MALRQNHREPWTLEQLTKLHILAAEGLPARAIAEHLGRTEEAVRTKAAQKSIMLRRPD